VSEWQPIGNVFEYLKTLDHLLERSSNIDTWGPVFVWSEKTKEADAGLYQAVYVEFRGGGKSYWKDHQRTDDNYEVKPTHWMPLPNPPQDKAP
jgi:hypothetical protein